VELRSVDLRFFIKSSVAQALIGYADRHTPVWLSLVVELPCREFNPCLYLNQ